MQVSCKIPLQKPSEWFHILRDSVSKQITMGYTRMWNSTYVTLTYSDSCSEYGPLVSGFKEVLSTEALCPVVIYWTISVLRKLPVLYYLQKYTTSVQFLWWPTSLPGRDLSRACCCLLVLSDFISHAHIPCSSLSRTHNVPDPDNSPFQARQGRQEHNVLSLKQCMTMLLLC